MHLKLRAILIIGLLTLACVAPAAADREYIMDTTYAEGRAVSIHFEKVVESDTSDVYSPFNFPPEKYKFVTLYYSLYNPSDTDKFYEFNISLRDQANRYFYTDEFIRGETVPAQKNLLRKKSFAVYRNSTNLQFVWTDKQPNPPWERYDTYLSVEFADATPAPQVTPTATPTPTPTPAPSGGCLPFLPIGLVITCLGGLGLLVKKHRDGR